MSLVGLLIAIIVIALLLWILEQIPLDATVKRVLQIVVAVIIILWLLGALGVLDIPLKVR